MKILHISRFDRGGASAVRRLHHALLEKNIHSDFLCLENYNPDILRKQIYEQETEKITFLDKIKIKLGLRSPHSFSDQQGLQLQNYPLGYGFTFPETLNKNLIHHPLYKNADILHLHWVNGFIDYPSFFKYNTKPIIWTLHDLHPFTGGFFYDVGTNYTTEQLLDFIYPEKNSLDKILNKNIRTKIKALEKQQIKVVATTKKMQELSEKSRIFSKFTHFHIPLGLDTEIFKPYDKDFCREKFALPKDKKIIIFASADLKTPYKGLHILLEALPKLKTDYGILAIGKKNKDLEKLDNIYFTGYITDEKTMAMAYSTGDIFVTPSLMEAFGQTSIEALACGLPVVAFPTWGAAEWLNSENGILVENTQAEALAEAIEAFLSEKIRFDTQKIRQKTVEKYGFDNVAPKYIALYKSFL